MLSSFPDTESRSVTTGDGAGGDRTLVIDAEAEAIVFDEFDKLAAQGLEFMAISEERGSVSYGQNPELRVIVDPIDGSLNAKRTLPYFSVSIAVACGSTMEDVEFGYVCDFGSGEEFWAFRGKGAWRDGLQLALPGSDSNLEIVALEGAHPARTAQVAQLLDGHVYRLRCLGSIALALSNVAAGRFDAMASMYPCRSVDAAAAQLIAREAGATVCFLGQDKPLAAALDLDSRYICLASASAENLAVLSAAVAT